MKTTNKLLAMVLMGLMPFLLTSCLSEDDEIAYDLQGIWRGSIKSTYYDYRYGHTTDYTDTQIEFDRDTRGYARGRGREIDYSSYGYSSVIGFNYSVRNGEIYLDYDDGSQIIIYNWEMYNDTFRGDFHDYLTNEYLASFTLYRVSSWGDGFNGYDWYNDWYATQQKALFPDEE